MQSNSDWSKQKSIKILAELRRNLMTFRFRFCRNEIPIPIGIKVQFPPEQNHIPTGLKSHSLSNFVGIYWHSFSDFVGMKFLHTRMKFLQEWNSNFHHNEIPIPTRMKFPFLPEWNSQANQIEIPIPTRLIFQFPPEWNNIPNQILSECTDISILILSEWNSNSHQNEIPIPTGMKSHS